MKIGEIYVYCGKVEKDSGKKVKIINISKNRLSCTYKVINSNFIEEIGIVNYEHQIKGFLDYYILVDTTVRPFDESFSE
jgi:hypothetical protein